MVVVRYPLADHPFKNILILCFCLIKKFSNTEKLWNRYQHLQNINWSKIIYALVAPVYVNKK
jgi:hypothetical protein